MSFLKKIFHKKKQEPNRVADDSTVIHIHPEDSHKIWLNVQGKNNVINIGKLSPKIVGDIHISVYGDNCSVNIGDGFFTCYGVHILLGLNHENYGKITASHLKIGNNTSMEGARIITFNSHNTISVGDECMLSENIMLYNTDSHPIYDKSTGKIINYVDSEACFFGFLFKAFSYFMLVAIVGCLNTRTSYEVRYNLKLLVSFSPVETNFLLCYLIVVIIVVFPTFFRSFRDIVAEAVFEPVGIILIDTHEKFLLVLLLENFRCRVVRIELISTIVSVIKACFSLSYRSEQIDFIKGFFIKFSRGFLASFKTSMPFSHAVS